jgi:hypothetical protein
MNPHHNSNYNNHQGRNPDQERLPHESGGTAEDDDLVWMMATPKVSWDESDGRIILPTPSCTKKITLSPPPLLPSNHDNNNELRSSSDDKIGSVLSLPSLDLLGDLQQPAFRLKKRKFVVGDDTLVARWQLRHRTSSDPMDYLVQQVRQHPQNQRRPQQQLQCITSSPSSTSAQHLTQRQRAVSYDQHGQPPDQQQQQRRCEEDTEEEMDELINLLLRK